MPAKPTTTILPEGPASGAFAVTPSDATIINASRGLYVGGTGTLVVEMINPETVGGTVTFSAVPVGTLLPIAVTRVLAASTATLIIGLR